MRVFITGMTGTLGTALAELFHGRGHAVWGCARNEARAADWLAAHHRLATLFVQDARALTSRDTDTGRLLPTMDVVYHCAAMKHVDLCEAQPEEAVRQNVTLSALVANACVAVGVRMVLVSSDKACLPQGTYGATKLLAERAVLARGGCAVRLGNLIGSSGSVFARWADAAARGGPIRLIDPAMTRYFMPLEQAARFMADCPLPGRVVIPQPLRAACLGEVAHALAAAHAPRGVEVEVAGGWRARESQHQWLVAPGEVARHDGNRLVLGEGQPVAGGWCSLYAPRWDLDDLLSLAAAAAEAE